jgi:hypothetical protein
MNSRVIAHMSTQGGLVTRAQAVEAGMAEHQIDRLTRTGKWTIVRKGVYADTALVESLSTPREKRILADHAASLRVRRKHVLSHHSSAYRNDLDVLHERPTAMSHLTRPGIVGSHVRANIKHHLAPYDPSLVVVTGGLPTLNNARTAADIAREQGYLQGLVAVDSALRCGTTKAELERVAASMKSWPGVTIVKDAIAAGMPDTDSIGETLTRDVAAELAAELGLPPPTVQFGLTADGRTAWCDVRVGRHLFEFDGFVKLRRIDEGGVAEASPEEVVWFEKQRQDFVCGFKVGMSRVVWDDVLGPGRKRAKSRLRRELLDTCQRFGTDISDLAAFRPRGPRPKPSRAWRDVPNAA